MRRFALCLLIATSASFAACGDDDPDNPDASVGADTGLTDGPIIPDSGRVDGGAPPDAEAADGGDAATFPDAEVPPDITIPGLTSTVTVDYDEHGIAHIGCRTNDDCIAAQGYVHASHRFGQMDLRRRFVRGKLSEIFALTAGEAVLNIDIQSRLFIATRDGERLEERMLTSADADTRAAIAAYTRGVNAWVADFQATRNGARTTSDWPVPAAFIKEWEELDTAACMLGLLEDLTNESNAEIEAGRLLAAIGPAEFFDLFGFIPASEALILPDTPELRREDSSLLGALENSRARLSAVRALLAATTFGDYQRSEVTGLGSNNWIVSPSQTADQKTLLANDPHLALDNPPIWYVNSMDATEGDLHIAGVSFAGVPGVILGHNENIAWGATTTFYDMADVYVETTTRSGSAVIFNGNEVPLTARQTVIKRVGFADHVQTLYYVPHHGPVVSTDEVGQTAITIRWVGHEADTDLNFLTAMSRARNVTEAKAALRNLTATGQNFIVADVEGNIGWFPYSRVPNRPWRDQYPPFLPLPGTGEAEWDGYYDYDDLPQAENPSEGYLATANGDMRGDLQDGDPTNQDMYIQHFVADGYRQQRILERLAGQEGQHTLETMQSIQADVHSSIGDDVVPPVLMLAAMANTVNADGASVVAALSRWNRECPTGLSDVAVDSAPNADPVVTTEAIGCMAFHALLGRLSRAIFDDEIEVAGLAGKHARISTLVILLNRPGALLNGSAYWDDVVTPAVETEPEIVAAALNETGAYLTAEFGAVDNWLWGRKHTLTLGSDFVDTINIGPFANDGGYSTVDVGNPNSLFGDDYAHSSGPSMRFACELDRTSGVDCTIELPGGQRTFSDSPFYSDLFQKWLVNEPYNVWFDQADVAANSEQQVPIRAP